MGAPTEECPPCEKGAPMWVTTFGDLMSLLLCFFVLLLSFSEMDKAKYKQVAGSMEKAFGVQRRTRVMESPKGIKMIAKDFDQEVIATRLKEEIGRELEEAFKNDLYSVRDELDVGLEEGNLVLRVVGESTFDSGSAEIRSETRPLLMKIGKIIAKANKDIVVAGYTDNIPIRKGRSLYSSNLRLSIARAAAVAEMLLANSDIDPARLSTMGFGQYRPIADNSTAEGRQKNRRVEIIVGNIPRTQAAARASP
jgi:chemotaxis protein MotB